MLQNTIKNILVCRDVITCKSQGLVDERRYFFCFLLLFSPKFLNIYLTLARTRQLTPQASSSTRGNAGGSSYAVSSVSPSVVRSLARATEISNGLFFLGHFDLVFTLCVCVCARACVRVCVRRCVHARRARVRADGILTYAKEPSGEALSSIVLDANDTCSEDAAKKGKKFRSTRSCCFCRYCKFCCR